MRIFSHQIYAFEIIFLKHGPDSNKEHFHHAKQILRYLAGTKNLGLLFTKSDLILHGYTDADYANDADDRKSTSGYAFFLGEALISWTSEKQPIVSLSSCESESVNRSKGSNLAAVII